MVGVIRMHLGFLVCSLSYEVDLVVYKTGKMMCAILFEVWHTPIISRENTQDDWIALKVKLMRDII